MPLAVEMKGQNERGKGKEEKGTEKEERERRKKEGERGRGKGEGEKTDHRISILVLNKLKSQKHTNYFFIKHL